MAWVGLLRAVTGGPRACADRSGLGRAGLLPADPVLRVLEDDAHVQALAADQRRPWRSPSSARAVRGRDPAWTSASRRFSRERVARGDRGVRSPTLARDSRRRRRPATPGGGVDDASTASISGEGGEPVAVAGPELAALDRDVDFAHEVEDRGEGGGDVEVVGRAPPRIRPGGLDERRDGGRLSRGPRA